MLDAPPAPVLRDLIDYLASSPTPFHAAANAEVRLSASGFRVLEMAESWANLTPGGYVVRQGDSALVAFVLPSEPLSAVRIVGAHTDSPNLRLKPHGEFTKEGYAQLAVEVYGGMLLNSWLDRDLAVAGRLIARTDTGALEARFVRLETPLCRVAQLAIHLDRDVNEKGVVLNKQEHLSPIFGMVTGDGGKPLAKRVAEAAHVALAHVVSMDLMLYDVTPPAIGGDSGEFLFSARLDNLAMCHAATTALVGASQKGAGGGIVPMVALFDHEEVGSDSAYGAGAPILERVIERLVAAKGGTRDDFHQVLARSMCISADMAHAVHPNYADKHDARHKVALNGGPVIKVNSNQRYATSARTGAIFEELCRRAEVPFQHYAHRTDLPCGSTIGPITATRLGIATVDVGNPMLSMHSIREMSGTLDHERMIRVQELFFTSAEMFL